MAKLQGKTLFFITSPRTPLKMVPEIQILIQNLSGKAWNTKTQEEFIKKLVSSPDFEGKGCPKEWILLRKLIVKKNGTTQ